MLGVPYTSTAISRYFGILSISFTIYDELAMSTSTINCRNYSQKSKTSMNDESWEVVVIFMFKFFILVMFKIQLAVADSFNVKSHYKLHLNNEIMLSKINAHITKFHKGKSRFDIYLLISFYLARTKLNASHLWQNC